jgi:hypothetical protein
MREQVEAARTLLKIRPGRKLASADNPGDLDRAVPPDPNTIGLSVGTDWGSIAGAWLTEWERTGNTQMRDRLLASMRTLGEQPHGFFTTGLTMNLNTGAYDVAPTGEIGISHLNAVFGLVEVCAELIQLLDVPGFRKVWLDYCELYNGSAELQTERLGKPIRGAGLRQGHSRLTAYFAKQTGNAEMAKRAWSEFQGSDGGPGGGRPRRAPQREKVSGPAVLRPVEEARFVSTNGTAQWGLAAIQCLALAGDSIPDPA